MSKDKVCLAYSGGLDTSCILKWLLEKGYDVICFLADVGQNEDFAAAKAKALKIGASEMIVADLRREFVEELCFTAVQCNAIFEGRYLLGTSLARPIIARAQMQTAKKYGCKAVSHGCTGKGRADLLDYAEKNGLPVTSTKAKPWSMDENLAHCSYEAGILENPDQTPPDDMWIMTDSPQKAPDAVEEFTLSFTKGLPTSLSWSPKAGGPTTTVTDSVELFLAVNEIGRRNGVGRIDIVENRFIGLKSRGCYDTPGLTILRLAHLDLEGLVLDREVRSLRDQFVTHTWSNLIYNGMYFSPEREFIGASVIASQKRVNGTIRMCAYKGSASVLGRSSETEKLYSAEEASMDTLENFSPVDTSGFIGIQSIRLKKYGLQKIEDGESLSGI